MVHTKKNTVISVELNSTQQEAQIVPLNIEAVG